MKILAVNPWIYDFAAYDFWLKPYGFLVLLSYLLKCGDTVSYVDCLDVKATLADYGRGKYPAEIIPTPEIFKKIPRYYKRYGISLDEFRRRLPQTAPEMILITSSMTYWYPGVQKAVRVIKKSFPDIPVYLGGTYATLCRDHAEQQSGCDRVFTDTGLEQFFTYINRPYDQHQLYITLPHYQHFYDHLDYIVFRTSWGCPFNCSYCAIKKLFSTFVRIPYEKVYAFIVEYARRGHKNFVLYDDAFLYESDYVKKLLHAVAKANLGLRFHTPNALHLRYLDEEIASLLKQTGFVNPHFGLETLDAHLQKIWGDKVTRNDVINGVNVLKKGGFKNGEFSMYLLLGYPEQDLAGLKADAQFLHSLGAKVSLAEYSPVPGTKIFELYKHDFSDEPLLQNNSIFGTLQNERFKDFWEIKNFVRTLNKSFSTS